MKKALSIAAFLGFFISLIVHLTTFFGIDVARHFGWVWGLHVGLFVVFLPMVFAQRRSAAKEFWSNLFDPMPGWQRYFVKGLFAYALINFALFMFLSKGGTSEEPDGTYVLRDRSRVVRQISAEEYERQNAYVLRGFSGHWMVFYLIPALYFWHRKDEIDAS